MDDRPQFKPHFGIYTIEEEKAVFLLSEHGYYLLQGKLYCLLAPLLDGRHNVDQIIDRLAGQASIAEIYYALGIMEKKGYITATEDSIPQEQLAFWSALGMEPKMAAEKLKNSRILVISLGSDPTTPLESAMRDIQVPIAADADLSIVLVDDYLQPELTELNKKFLREKQSWMLVKAGGIIPWLGPIFIPGETGCWECLAQRLRINRDVEEHIRSKQGLPSPVNAFPAALPATRQLVWSMLATEIAKHLLTGQSLFSGAQVISIDTLTMKTEAHTLLKRPQCPVCGVPNRINTACKAPLLQPAPKLFTADGGHRKVLPEQTLRKHGHHVSSITGVVKYLKNAAEDDPFLKVYHSGPNNAVSYGNLAFLRRGLRSQSSGKGMTEVQARAGALCEALERHSGVFRGDEVRIRATFRELGEKAIHPNRIMNFSEAQYQNREMSNAREEKFNRVPEPFDEDQEMDWTPVWSLTYEKHRYLPTSFCYHSHSEIKTVFSCSNGNASGNIIEEAILQGFLELVERDSVALWWYNRLNMPGVDLDSFNESYIKEMRSYYHARNREIWALDLTSDLGIPAFAALVRKTNSEEEGIVMGFGAHLEARVALIRALTELNQMMPFVLNMEGTKDEKLRIDDNATMSWLRQATVANQPYLLPHPDIPQRKAGEYKDLSSDDFLKDIETCRRIVEGKGMEMLFLDQTRADIGMPVVKVFVPGLRHFWKRFAPGRLYDVPVQMGWLPKAKPESAMNPIGVFL